MRFALLGNHWDGVEIVLALAGTGRHELATYTGPEAGAEILRRRGLRFNSIRDLEEVLADPQIEAVVIAGPDADRAAQLRRALQSERHVLCVYPPDHTPDTAYEAAMIQGDTKCVLLPLLPGPLHPGIRRLAEMAYQPSTLGTLHLLEVEFLSQPEAIPEVHTREYRPSLPGWDILRAVGGEVAELSAVAAGEHLSATEPLAVSGRFERGGLFQVSYLFDQRDAHWRLSWIGSYSRADLVFPLGWPGAARLCWQDETGSLREEAWEAWNPWLPLVEIFETAVASAGQSAAYQERDGSERSAPALLSWQTAIRSLELNDAARRSVERRRVSTLEYPEPTEEVGFKGTMTLVGCGLLWLILLLAVLSVWFPWLGWAIGPVLVFFLGLQIFRWLVPAGTEQVSGPSSEHMDRNPKADRSTIE
jgi:predicted dehydrogenase